MKQGFPPSVVAQNVFEAIRDERFYVFAAQPEIFAAVEQRLDDVRARQATRSRRRC